MPQSGIFSKKRRGFNPEEVLDYIEQLQNDKVTKENQLLKEISDLNSKINKLNEEIQNQIEINQSFKEKINKCEEKLKELYELTNTYSEDSHKAVKIESTIEQLIPEQKTYKITQSKFDIIKNKIASIGNLINETKNYIFNK